MSIEVLDITPNKKGLKYKETQICYDKARFVIHTFKNMDGMKRITLCTTSLAPPIGHDVIMEHKISFGIDAAKELIDILQYSIIHLERAPK